MERSKSKRLSLLRKLVPHKTSSEEVDRRSSLQLSPVPTRSSTPAPVPRLPSSLGVEEPLSSSELSKHFSGLHEVIIAHVRRFYSTEGVDKRISQNIIEHASAGINLPWPQILGLLGDVDTRLSTLALCISWTILSRTLLLRLGASNSPDSTFLPPEIIECFQSFSLGKGAITITKDETGPVNFKMLSRWKQLTASLSHTTYVTEAFSFFDARTMNVERALKELDPLLTTFATPRDPSDWESARLDDLRKVLRQGAVFAFTLFSQPSFWRFDWRSDRAAAHGKVEAGFDLECSCGADSTGTAAPTSVMLTSSEIVVWPSLVMIVDEDGVKPNGDVDKMVFGEKKYLADFRKM